MPLSFQPLALWRRDPTLPDSRIRNRLPRGPVPQDRGLALIRDSESSDGLHSAGNLGDGLSGSLQLGLPDLFGVVLDVSGSWVDLRELSLRFGHNKPGVIDHQGTAAGRALIKRENETFHHSPQRMPHTLSTPA